jgi:hypothetical protein
MGIFKKFIENRKEIKLAKIQAKTQRKESKWDAFSIAYSQGIDPRASVASAVGSAASNIAGSASSALTSMYGFGFSPGNRPKEAYGKGDTLAASPNMLMYVILGVLALFIFKQKN